MIQELCTEGLSLSKILSSRWRQRKSLTWENHLPQPPQVPRKAACKASPPTQNEAGLPDPKPCPVSVCSSGFALNPALAARGKSTVTHRVQLSGGHSALASALLANTNSSLRTIHNPATNILGLMTATKDYSSLRKTSVHQRTTKTLRC